MAAAILTNNEALALYNQSLLILEQDNTVTTRNAVYTWDADQGNYSLDTDGLEVAHRAGVRWHKHQRCFVECTCRWCITHPRETTQYRIRTTGQIA
jgi:hypothetical protein